MINPKVGISWHMIFNNTEVNSMEFQNAIVELVEKEYGVLHCIGDKYMEDETDNYYEIQNVPCLIYMRVNPQELILECIVVKTEKRTGYFEEEQEEDELPLGD